MGKNLEVIASTGIGAGIVAAGTYFAPEISEYIQTHAGPAMDMFSASICSSISETVKYASWSVGACFIGYAVGRADILPSYNKK